MGYCLKCGKYSGTGTLCEKCYYEETHTCEICGEYSGKYNLCKKCYYKVKEYAEEHYEDFIDLEDDDFEDDDYETFSQGYCIACNKEKEYSDYFLCSKCYKKYRSKELILSLIKGQEIKILESRYYSKYKCNDGHFVKSKAEREIDNFFDKWKIRHYYEPEIPLDTKPENSIHPDFYLPDLNVYIEYFGIENNEQYKESEKYKIKIYKKLKITLICLYEHTDAKDIEDALKRKLKHYKKGVINFIEE